MHTNMDATGLSEVADEVLGIKRERAIEVNINQDNEKIGMGSIGKFLNDNKESVDIMLREAVIRTKKGFGLNVVKVYGDLDSIISRVAVCTGAGKSMIDECIKENCDLLITGDMTYHAALDAVARGLNIIDAGHYGTEIIFVDLVRAFFEMNFPDITIIPSIQKEVGEYM
jgi:putative NIF3 family GTP cyclohydrolase 1 type 2